MNSGDAACEKSDVTGGRRQRISVVTIGVGDLGRAKRFYEHWGWVLHHGDDEIAFYQGNGMVIALFPLSALAEDQGRPDAVLGTGAIALAQNFPTHAEVDERFRAAAAAGASMLKPPAETEWGGYSGYIADPDGHVWELAVNPFWDLASDGAVSMPDQPQGA